MWHVYILECKNKTLYTGITKDIVRRFKEHKQGKGSRFTRSFGVNKLVYQKNYPTRAEALKRESQIKRWPRSKKLSLIKGLVS